MAAKQRRAAAPQALPIAERKPLPAWALYTLGSVAALIPCFWQSRIQAGDLASHIYNAWLAQLIHQGQAPGLKLVSLSTNVLFDWIAGWLLPVAGAGATQHIAVPLAVLNFVWGAFAFVKKVAGKRPDIWLIAIVMVAYGWVFHMGFFNYYISLGLCFWALSLAWDLRPAGIAAAAPVFALAYLAHGLPLAWSVGVLVYRFAADRLLPKRRGQVFAVAVTAVLLLTFTIGSLWKTHWFSNQLAASIGVDQVVPYADRYWWVSLLLAVALTYGIAYAIRFRGWRSALAWTPIHIAVLTSLGIVVIPNWISIPNYSHALVFLAQRTSLPLCIVLCAVAASSPPQRMPKYVLVAAAAVFFGFLYRDEAALNGLEDQIAAAVAQLPKYSRVLTAVEAAYVRSNPVSHMIDRECIGRCYSYGNYEPSSAQFRVRIDGASPLVVPTDRDANQLQGGSYVVQPRDIPVYQIFAQPDGQLMIRQLAPGMPSGMTAWNGL